VSGHLDLGVSCPLGHAVDVVNVSQATGARTSAVLHCDTCQRDLAVEVTLSWLGSRGPLHWNGTGSGERSSLIKAVAR
jgi:hypothetical protein